MAGRLSIASWAMCALSGIATADDQIPANPQQPPPVEDFARDFAYESVEISPDGEHLAVTHLRDGSTNLGVVDLAVTRSAALTGLHDPDNLEWFVWKSNEYVLYVSSHHDVDVGQFPILTAASRDGKRILNLNYNPLPDGRYTSDYVLDRLREDPGFILVVSQADRREYPTVYRTDIRHVTSNNLGPSGSAAQWPTPRQALFSPPGRECRYLTDNAGVVRTCWTWELDNSHRLLYRGADHMPWTELAQFAAQKDYILPVGLTADNRELYVISSIGRDTSALYRYDPEKKALGELLFETAGADIDRPIYADGGRRLVAVTYFKQWMGIFYLDTGLEAIHIALNKSFPGKEVRLVSLSDSNRRIVVWAGTPSTPGTYYVYDNEKHSLAKLFDIAPWIDAAKMGRVKPVAFKASDGVPLQGYLTLPPGRPAKNLPLIVNVHGGPYGVRDIARFDRESQLFASRGYAVLQINFRGSGGYGREFRSAGFGQWGQRMQDDISDGVRWLISEGTVDANRVGIFGGSYGGYAAMMALIRAPELFKCAVTYAGVSNLVRMVNARVAFMTSGAYREIGADERRFWESVMGNRHDEAALKEISPLYQVDKVHAPVLIAHGLDDLTVPVADATDLHRALKHAGKEAELLVIPKEGHGFFLEKDRVEFYKRLDTFFGKYLPAILPAT